MRRGEPQRGSTLDPTAGGSEEASSSAPTAEQHAHITAAQTRSGEKLAILSGCPRLWPPENSAHSLNAAVVLP